MSTFNNFTGQMAQLEFSLQLLADITGGKDRTNTLKKACEGEVFDNATLEIIEKTAKKIHKLSEPKKKEEAVWNFRKELFSYCGLKE